MPKKKRDFAHWDHAKQYVIDRLHEVNMAEASRNAKVSYWWVVLLKKGGIPEPGFAKLGRLFEVLGGKPPRIPASKQEKPNGSSADVQGE